MGALRDNASVLLIEPGRGFDLTYPLGLAYLAGHLRRAGVDVCGIDLRIESRSALRVLLRERHFDVVGIRLLSTGAAEAAAICSTVRQMQPSAALVVGGPHATLAPTDALDRTGADAVIRGDGEVPLLALLRGEREAAGLARRAGPLTDIHVHGPLHELDFPDRSVFPVKRYYGQGTFGHLPRTAMIATRGCFKRCGYCSANALSGGAFRKREAESVVEEILRLRKDHGLRGIVFEDDNLLLDSEYARALFSSIARHAPGTVMDLPNGVNPDLIDEAMIDEMAAAGVRSMAFGLESLSWDNQLALDRVFDPGHFERVARHARSRGISTTGYFMIGLPQDTPGALASEFPAIRRLPLDMAHVSVFRPLPGQPMHHPGSPMPDAVLESLRIAFYGMYYTEPRRAAALIARAGGGIRGAGRLALRAAQWLRG